MVVRWARSLCGFILIGAETFQKVVRLGLKNWRSRRIGGWAWGGGVPLPSRLGCLGERRELSQPRTHFIHILGPQNAAGGDKKSIYLT